MIYEIEFRLPLAKNEAGDRSIITYLNALLGEGRWLDLEPQCVNSHGENTCKTFRFLCRAPEVMVLKWADICDGERRVLSERVLSGAERNHYRSLFGKRFPW
ncbi:hypothetical protein [Asticcacaulis sp. MM231]|uniref:hypothetical protein n=1 Tax=Asticcacaulis sp. MM231 TaxID=3157666 RepID=UPI0032D58A8F